MFESEFVKRYLVAHSLLLVSVWAYYFRESVNAPEFFLSLMLDARWILTSTAALFALCVFIIYIITSPKNRSHHSEVLHPTPPSLPSVGKRETPQLSTPLLRNKYTDPTGGNGKLAAEKTLETSCAFPLVETRSSAQEALEALLDEF